ncbi:hypothetical protein LA080_003555 [Diaporthe eres]|nr:hypothetical protein LA080_003555 [Diaporthe eres]
MMAASTPPNASAKACSFPASDGRVALTEGIRPTNLFPATAGATTRTERLGIDDDDKDGFDILLSGAGQSSSPSTVTSGRCGNKDDSTSPTSSPSRHIRFVDATIRAVRPAEAPVSVDTLGFSRKPTLPRLRTSMVDCSSSLSPMERYLNTESPSPSASVDELARDSKRWSTEQGQPDTIRDYAGLLEKKFTIQCGIEDIDKKFFRKPSFKSRLRRLSQSKASKCFGNYMLDLASLLYNCRI